MVMRRIGEDIFGNDFEKYLDGAEIMPSENVWNAIDAELANMEAIKLRKQVVFYRRIAASLFVLLVSSIVLAWQYTSLINSLDNPQSTNYLMALGDSADHPILPDNDQFAEVIANKDEFILKTNKGASGNSTFNKSYKVENNQKESQISQIVSANNLSGHSANQVKVSQLVNRENIDQIKIAKTTNGSKDETIIDNSLYLKNKADLVIITKKGLAENDKSVNKIQPLVTYFQQIPVYDFVLNKKNNLYALNEAKNWADFNVKGGLFDPNYQRTGNSNDLKVSAFDATSNSKLLRRNSFTADNNVFDGEDQSAGYSYTFNLNFGKRLTKRLFVQSGIEYGLYEAISSTNRVIADNRGEARVAVTEQIIINNNLNVQDADLDINFENVELNNSFQFATIPLKLGYVILNRRINISVNGGISTGFYLGNNIIDPDRMLEAVTVSPGEGSLYRAVNFNLISGFSFGYQLRSNLIITMEPTYQRALRSYTRNSSDFISLPENFALSAGLRFIIN